MAVLDTHTANTSKSSTENLFCLQADQHAGGGCRVREGAQGAQGPQDALEPYAVQPRGVGHSGACPPLNLALRRAMPSSFRLLSAVLCPCTRLLLPHSLPTRQHTNLMHHAHT